MKTYFEYMTEVFEKLEEGIQYCFDFFFSNGYYPPFFENGRGFGGGVIQGAFVEVSKMLEALKYKPENVISDWDRAEMAFEDDPRGIGEIDLWGLTFDMQGAYDEQRYHPDLEWQLEQEGDPNAEEIAQEAYDADREELLKIEQEIENWKQDMISFCERNGLT